MTRQPPIPSTHVCRDPLSMEPVHFFDLKSSLPGQSLLVLALPHPSRSTRLASSLSLPSSRRPVQAPYSAGLQTHPRLAYSSISGRSPTPKSSSELAHFVRSDLPLQLTSPLSSSLVPSLPDGFPIPTSKTSLSPSAFHQYLRAPPPCPTVSQPFSTPPSSPPLV